MTKLSARKTKLKFTPGATVHHTSRERSVAIECDSEFHGNAGLQGTRVSYPFAWGSVFRMATVKYADALRAKRKKMRDSPN
jgi:hypothetical protein